LRLLVVLARGALCVFGAWVALLLVGQTFEQSQRALELAFAFAFGEVVNAIAILPQLLQ
jgi:hypothetical protein